MYKTLATAALVATASAVSGYSTSVCTETSTYLYQSSTEYSTYYVTHTLDASPSSDSATATSAAGYDSTSEASPSSYAASSSPAAPESYNAYDSSCTARTSTLIYRSTTLYETYPVVAPTSYPSGGEDTTVTDVTTVYTTTCPASSVYTSGSETLTSTYTTVSTLTSTYQSTITGYASSPASPVDTQPAAYPPPAESSPASPETTGEVPAPSSPASPEQTVTHGTGIGSYIMNPNPPPQTTLPPVVPYPVPSGNATLPTGTGASSGLPPSTPATSGYPVQQTGGAVAIVGKPVGAMLGLAGLAAALL